MRRCTKERKILKISHFLQNDINGHPIIIVLVIPDTYRESKCRNYHIKKGGKNRNDPYPLLIKIVIPASCFMLLAFNLLPTVYPTIFLAGQLLTAYCIMSIAQSFVPQQMLPAQSSPASH